MWNIISKIDWMALVTATGALVAAITGVVRAVTGAKKPKT